MWHSSESLCFEMETEQTMEGWAGTRQINEMQAAQESRQPQRKITIYSYNSPMGNCTVCVCVCVCVCACLVLNSKFGDLVLPLSPLVLLVIQQYTYWECIQV